ncbi:MAG: triose-phosphate isomerase [Thermoleophilia bacterium]|nr:triose-phosphate isomerase [Thermoleophilia bacterium]
MGTSPRVPLVVGNWKMHKTSSEGAAFVRDLACRLGQVADREVMVAPPFTGLAEAVRAADGTCIGVAAQDVFWEKEGAFTGEISPLMLSSLGVKACIIGHSERRKYFGETDEWVAKKVRAALDWNLMPIACVGEDEGQRDAGLTREVVVGQLEAALALVKAWEARQVVVAYEPVWAIGTGRTATPEAAQEVIGVIRERVSDLLGEAAALGVRVLYGGSVTPQNIDGLMAQPDIDGVLVGGASLDIDAFARIVRFVCASET